MIRYVALSCLTIATALLQAQTIIFEENFTAGIPAGWTIVDADGLDHATPVATYPGGWFDFTTATDTCAASTSYYNPPGQSADYLVTPKITLSTFTKLVWSARSYDASYPDDYLVLISSTDSLTSSFTDTLMVVEAEDYTWHTRSIQLDLEGYASQDVYIAFKNITNDGYILMIDDVTLLGSDFASVSGEEALRYNIYPNPCSNELFVANFQTGDVVTIYGIDGTILITSAEQAIDVSGLSNGAYVCTVTSGNEVFTSVFSKR